MLAHDCYQDTYNRISVLPGFLVWVQLRRNSRSVGGISFISVNSFSHVKIHVLLSRRTELVSSEQRPAISRRSDVPKPLTIDAAMRSLQNIS